MKILVLAVHFEVTGARYIADAFARLGHDVKHTGPKAPLRMRGALILTNNIHGSLTH